MQEERLRLRALRVDALPILNAFIERMGLEEELTLALKNGGYADALLALVKNILVERNALYAIREWAEPFEPGLLARSKVNDDKLGRALDRLFTADRATLQTRIVLAIMKGFDLKMDRIHNDTTSVMVRGAYDGQNPRAVQLKTGHSKERRPDLKQLVYSLCVTSDGAVPVHFKAYDGNQTDDGIHLETWNRLRTLLQHPRFIYVADCKLCTEKNLRTIDAEHGFFVTVVPKTYSEVEALPRPCLQAMCAGRRSCASVRIGIKRPSTSSSVRWAPIICGKGSRSTGTDRARRRNAMRAIAKSGSSAR
jgi:transposase